MIWRRYALAAAGVATAVVAAFALAAFADLPVLDDPRRTVRSATAGAALAGVALLVADVVLPVPSSTVMVAHGALFGVVPGALLSLTGNVGAVLAGWLAGRAGHDRLVRTVPLAQRERAARLLARWGPAAIVLTRPLPVLAETVTVMAGAAGMDARRVVAAGAAGSLPVAVAYAVTGAVATSAVGPAAVFLALAVVAAATLALTAWRGTPPPRPPGAETGPADGSAGHRGQR